MITAPGKANRIELRLLLVVSAACAVISSQPIYDGYGSHTWQLPVLSFILLALVYFRRSRAARVIAAMLATFGLVLFTLAAFESRYAGVLALVFLGELLPLLTPTVKAHVGCTGWLRTSSGGCAHARTVA